MAISRKSTERRGAETAKTVAVGCDRLPETFDGKQPQTNCRSRLVLSADWAMHSGEAVHEWLRTKTILLCSFRTIAADLETPAT